MENHISPARSMAAPALLAALLCVAGPVTLPAGPLPLSLATLVIYLASGLLGPKGGLLTAGVYLAIGAVGLPVFSGFAGGLGQLFGPTGGYLVGYLPLAFLSGLGKGRGRVGQLLAMLAGTALLYLMGSFWYALRFGTTLWGSVVVCVLPFLPGDGVKIALALAFTPALKRALERAGRMED